MVWVTLRRRLRGVQEPLVAHVAFTAAEEDVGTLLPLHTLVTAEDIKVELAIRNTRLQMTRGQSSLKHEQTSSAWRHDVS